MQQKKRKSCDTTNMDELLIGCPFFVDELRDHCYAD